jgi:hypothetical protein
MDVCSISLILMLSMIIIYVGICDVRSSIQEAPPKMPMKIRSFKYGLEQIGQPNL